MDEIFDTLEAFLDTHPFIEESGKDIVFEEEFFEGNNQVKIIAIGTEKFKVTVEQLEG